MQKKIINAKNLEFGIDELPSLKIINSVNILQEFLGKFGYVKPAEWSSVSPRFYVDEVSVDGSDDSLADRLEGSGEKVEIPREHYIYNSYVDISAEEYERALLKYQRINGLNTTGELDEDTRSYMGRPR